jgi:membrane protease YdiL (CAAX protease family)
MKGLSEKQQAGQEHVQRRDVGWSLLRRHPLVVLFVLTLVLTWVVWVPRAVGVDTGLVGRAWTYAPAVAAVLAATLTGRRAALKQLMRRLTRWRVPWQWYLVVIIGPAAFSAAIAGLYAASGGSWSAALPRAFGAPVLLLPILLLVLTGTDGLGEELAWRSFALPRLLAGHSALDASLIVGFFWSLWHLPLLWTDGIQEQQLPVWLLLLDIPAKFVPFTWVFLHTRGSVLVAALLYGSTNLFTVSPAVSETGDLVFPVIATAAKWLLVLLAKWLLVLLLVALTRVRLATRANQARSAESSRSRLLRMGEEPCRFLPEREARSQLTWTAIRATPVQNALAEPLSDREVVVLRLLNSLTKPLIARELQVPQAEESIVAGARQPRVWQLTQGSESPHTAAPRPPRGSWVSPSPAPSPGHRPSLCAPAGVAGRGAGTGECAAQRSAER